MDRNDREAIEGLFQKLAQVERGGTSRDPEAEGFIREQIARHPGAPYYMAQTIVVQEQALEAAQARIDALEAPAKDGAGGGLFNSIFGDNRRPTSVPGVGRGGATGTRPAPQPQAGGGFLAGAAQTAIGVAGGVLLGNAIAGMLGGSGTAQAAEAETGQDDAARDGAQLDNADYETGGFDDGGFGDLGGLDI